MQRTFRAKGTLPIKKKAMKEDFKILFIFSIKFLSFFKVPLALNVRSIELNIFFIFL